MNTVHKTPLTANRAVNSPVAPWAVYGTESTNANSWGGVFNVSAPHEAPPASNPVKPVADVAKPSRGVQLEIPTIMVRVRRMPLRTFLIGTRLRRSGMPIYGATYHIKATSLKSAVYAVRRLYGCNCCWSLFLCGVQT